MVENEHSRKIYFPDGEWFDFLTHEKYSCIPKIRKAIT
jgi:alpha-glucosidase (family GH31 glycosyl hydrolase)